jgi:hypothetical protein
MRKRLPLLAAVTALALALSSTAYAFDCIRVSSSAAGLAASTKSGNWLALSFGTLAEFTDTIENGFGVPLTDEQATCMHDAYLQTGLPLYVALGIGVAGGKKTSAPSHGARGDNLGVLVWHNPNSAILADSKGIDHFEDSILPALFQAAADCGVDTGA